MWSELQLQLTNMIAATNKNHKQCEWAVGPAAPVSILLLSVLGDA